MSDHGAAVLKFTILILRAAVHQYAKYSNSVVTVVPPDPSVHFYHCICHYCTCQAVTSASVAECSGEMAALQCRHVIAEGKMASWWLKGSM